jgi:hypothetical protein
VIKRETDPVTVVIDKDICTATLIAAYIPKYKNMFIQLHGDFMSSRGGGVKVNGRLSGDDSTDAGFRAHGDSRNPSVADGGGGTGSLSARNVRGTDAEVESDSSVWRAMRAARRLDERRGCGKGSGELVRDCAASFRSGGGT